MLDLQVQTPAQFTAAGCQIYFVESPVQTDSLHPPAFLHVKEIWGQWLHLAEGLHPGEKCPMPSPDVDLYARYGPEHATKARNRILEASNRRQLNAKSTQSHKPW